MYDAVYWSSLVAETPTTTQSYPMSKWLAVLDAWRAKCEPGQWPERRLTMLERAQVATATATSKEFITRVMDRVAANEPLGPKKRGGAHNFKMTPEVVDFVADLYAHNIEMEIWQYQAALYHLGIYVSTGTLSHCLRHTLQLTPQKPTEVRTGKYEDDNLIYCAEYVQAVANVPRERLRFLDEMGSDSRNTGRKKIRWPRGFEAHVGTPGPKGEHLTTTGITCLRADKPALIYDVHGGGHTAQYHQDWMVYVAEGGGFDPGDCLIVDNWSGHVNDVGKQTEAFLTDHFGVTTVALPKYMPQLNPIELVWASVKMWMRRFPRGKLDEHCFALASSLNCVDHDLIDRLYSHRGY